MNKKKTLILITLIIFFGSFVTFYANNLLCSDVSNMFYGVHDANILSSIPLFMIALDISALVVFLMRYTRYPKFRKGYGAFYSLFLTVTSGIGIVTCVLSGAYIYHSFTAPYPFPGYLLIGLCLHALLCALGVLLFCRNRKTVREGQEKKRMKLHYVLYSALLGGMIYYALNRLGALLWAPVYVHLRTLYLTFPFYLSMLCPIALVVHVLIYFFDGYVGREKAGVITVSVIGGVSLGLSVTVLILGATHTEFISAVSPALPLERLATMPINSLFQLAATLVFSGYYLYYALRAYKLSKQK